MTEPRRTGGFVLPEYARRAFSSRLMLQAPPNLTERQIEAVRRDLDRRVRGLSADVFMSLDALRLLAEQGNKIAEHLFEVESRRLGLTERFYSLPK